MPRQKDEQDETAANAHLRTLSLAFPRSLRAPTASRASLWASSRPIVVVAFSGAASKAGRLEQPPLRPFSRLQAGAAAMSSSQEGSPPKRQVRSHVQAQPITGRRRRRCPSPPPPLPVACAAPTTPPTPSPAPPNVSQRRALSEEGSITSPDKASGLVVCEAGGRWGSSWAAVHPAAHPRQQPPVSLPRPDLQTAHCGATIAMRGLKPSFSEADSNDEVIGRSIAIVGGSHPGRRLMGGG